MNTTEIIALVSAITALVIALTHLITDIRSKNAQSKAAAKLPSPANSLHVSAENKPFEPQP